MGRIEVFVLTTCSHTLTMASMQLVPIITAMLGLCSADKDDCTMWKCDNHKSTTSSDDYHNCTQHNPYWSETYECTYCEIINNGICWCTSEPQCTRTDHIYFGIAMMAMSTLCIAIIWFKHCKQYKKMKNVKQRLLQQKERESKIYRCKSSKTSSINTEGVKFDSDYSSSSDSEDIAHKTMSELRSTLGVMEKGMDEVSGCGCNCFCIWLMTCAATGIFLVGL